MTSRRTAALGAVAALLVAAFAVGLTHRGATPDRALVALRRQAALEACPTGVSQQLPALTLPCLGGGPPVHLASTSGPGRPLLVNVWAHWCGPCVQEVPLLAAFRARAAGRVGVLGVLTEDDPATALSFAHDFGMRWASVEDTDGVVLRRFLPGPPVTLFVDATGRIVWRHSGRFHTEAELAGLVAAHLGVRV